MAKLTTIKPRLAGLVPRLGYVVADERSRSRYRDATQGWRAWYKTARWQKLRWSILTRDLFTCKMCGKIEGQTSQLVCDHIERHGGDEARFWAGPFQTLCKPCHDRDKQKIERRHG